jgi:ectoine hydroxylase-related dioxygenase (phytanoyl-CoA dioxygenase family)
MRRSIPTRVTEALVKQFEDDGVVCLRATVDARWRDGIAAAIERDFANPGPFVHDYEGGGGRFHGNSRRWRTHPELHAYVFGSPLPELAARFLRSSKVNLLYDQIFAKEPGTPTPTPWHMDHSVWPLSGYQVVSFWVTLDPVTADTGAMRFVRGSHKWRKLFQPRSFAKSKLAYDTDPTMEEVPDIDGDPDRYEVIGWDMEPGDVLVFTSYTLHAAGGNSSTATRRRAYSVRYTGDDVAYAPRPNTMPVLDNPQLRAGDPLDSDLFPVVWSDGRRVAPPSPVRDVTQQSAAPERCGPGAAAGR